MRISPPHQAYEAVTGKNQVNLTSPTPRFVLGGLNPGLDYVVLVTATNRMGESEARRMEAVTYKMAENRMCEYIW